MPQDNQWHLDKRVPVTLIVALLVHAGATVWWGSAINARVGHIESYIEDAKRASAAAMVEERDRSNRLVRLETHMQNIWKELQGISRKLDGRPYPPPDP